MRQGAMTLGDVERHPELLYPFVAEITRPMVQYCVRNFRRIHEEDAENLVQDALLKLSQIVTQRQVQKQETPAIAWMYQELKWRCIDLMRNKERFISSEEGEETDDGADKIETLPDSTISIEDDTVQRESARLLRECIQTEMKGRRREIFEIYLKGYEPAEIARELRVTKAYVSKETQIGYEQLRKCLKRRGLE